MTITTRHRAHGPAVLVAMMAIIISTVGAVPGAAFAQADETGQMQDDAIQQSRTGTFEIHVQGADLRGVLQLLSTQGKRNIVATKEVTGKVTSWTLQDLDQLREAVEELRPSLLVIDPLQAYLGARVDMNNANEVRPVLAALGAMSEEFRDRSDT